MFLRDMKNMSFGKKFLGLKFFFNNHPVCLELCSGNGAWIGEKAKKFPEKNWVAVEKKFHRARKIWLKSFREELPNLLTVWGEAEPFLKFYVENGGFSEVYINFPDPWPKLRHARHRLVQKELIHDLTKSMKRKSSLNLVTDDAPYARQMIDVCLNAKELKPALSEPYYKGLDDEYGSSFFKELWEQKEKKIHLIPFEVL